MEVVWLRRARRHLAEIITYIADDNPAAAISVRQRIEEAARALSAHPEMGRHGRIDGTRELVIPGLPYIIPYRVRHGRVEILAVIHTARRWHTLRRYRDRQSPSAQANTRRPGARGTPCAGLPRCGCGGSTRGSGLARGGSRDIAMRTGA